MADNLNASCVVVVIAPTGVAGQSEHCMLSRPSLMTEDEAEHEASLWRTTEPVDGKPWRAVVRDVGQ